MVGLNLDGGDRPLPWSRDMGEAVCEIEHRTVCRADDQLLHRIIVDRYPLMGAGSFAGNEVPVSQANEQAADAIGSVEKDAGPIDGHTDCTNHDADMGRLLRSQRRRFGR